MMQVESNDSGKLSLNKVKLKNYILLGTEQLATMKIILTSDFHPEAHHLHWTFLVSKISNKKFVTAIFNIQYLW